MLFLSSNWRTQLKNCINERGGGENEDEQQHPQTCRTRNTLMSENPTHNEKFPATSSHFTFLASISNKKPRAYTLPLPLLTPHGNTYARHTCYDPRMRCTVINVTSTYPHDRQINRIGRRSYVADAAHVFSFSFQNPGWRGWLIERMRIFLCRDW